jgi:hypothetical protein
MSRGTPREHKPMPPGREARPPRPARPEVPDTGAGRSIVVASWAGTGALAVTAVPAAVAPHAFEVLALVIALALFAGGTATFLWAYAIAIGRSRDEEVSVAGLYGLAGTAPPTVRVRLFGALAAQAVVSVATASARLYSSLSFGILAVLWGLGLIGLWGAKHGTFPPRRDAGRPPGRRRASR